MKFTIQILGAALVFVAGPHTEAMARGFGAARGGMAVGPRGGTFSGGARVGGAVGPYGGFGAGGAQHRTYTAPGGTTIQGGRVGGVGVGPLGGVHAGGAHGARVTTPGGQSFTTGGRGGVTVGPAGGVRASGAHGAAISGPFGSAAAGYRGGVTVGPGGAGVARVGGAAVGHTTRYVSPYALNHSAAVVRTGYHYTAFNTGWYRAHPAAWYPARWRVPIWVVPPWPTVALYCGISAPPVIYDYGSTVVIENNNVYYNGEQVATAPQYAEQATQYADRGRQAKPSADEDWQPLGVFGLVQGDEKIAQNIFQLAVNKGGIIRGNYYDAVADNTLQVYGAVDPKTQRAAWSIGEKKTIVFETGVNNLTQEQTPVLVHYGTERTQQMLLVRLPDPGGEKK
ncbi:MAG TPA: hypothetical protein VEL76_35815 [Gemmataceae bacterium]|nr:hypothetical protein [Gemmataceae bacterium]